MAWINDTNCCALYQICCDNDDTIKEIKEEIFYYEDTRNIGKTYFAITTEKETKLEKRLIKIGFEHKHTFPSIRDKGKMLKMWFYTAEKKDA